MPRDRNFFCVSWGLLRVFATIRCGLGAIPFTDVHDFIISLNDDGERVQMIAIVKVDHEIQVQRAAKI